MVLLTPGHVTILLSSVLITVFTFLLFLSGYVLQQQTVRSLQAALHPPPLPKPTLPTYFSDVENITQLTTGESEHPTMYKPIRGSSKQEVLDYVKSVMPEGVKAETQSLSKEEVTLLQSSEQKPLGDLSQDANPPSAQQEESKLSSPGQDERPMDSKELQQGSEQEHTSSKAKVPLNSEFAYAVLVPQPSLICSAILFYSHLSYSQSSIPNRIILYPSYWEDSEQGSEAFSTALRLLTKASVEQKITIGPVQLPADVATRSLSTTDIELLMLSSLASAEELPIPPTVETIFYIEGPGLLINAQTLDMALTSFKSSPRDWSPISTETGSSAFPKPSSRSSPGSHLLLTVENSPSKPQVQFYSPSSDRTTSLVLSAMSSHDNNHAAEMEIEARTGRGSGTGYVLFSEDELRHRRGEKEWYGGVYERFERGRKEICPAEIQTVLESQFNGSSTHANEMNPTE